MFVCEMEVSLCSHVWPQTHRALPSVCLVLRLKVCISVPVIHNFNKVFLQFFFSVSQVVLLQTGGDTFPLIGNSGTVLGMVSDQKTVPCPDSEPTRPCHKAAHAHMHSVWAGPCSLHILRPTRVCCVTLSSGYPHPMCYLKMPEGQQPQSPRTL